MLTVEPLDLAVHWQGVRDLYIASNWNDPGMMPRQRDEFIVATIDGVVVGAAMFWDASPELSLGEILVAQGHRSTGVGTQLVHAVAEHAQSGGFEYIWTWPSPTGGAEHHARRVLFFERCGFVAKPKAEDEQLVMIGDPATVVARTAGPGQSRSGSTQPTAREG